jgi:tyrosine-protein phosphatase SIW14
MKTNDSTARTRHKAWAAAAAAFALTCAAAAAALTQNITPAAEARDAETARQTAQARQVAAARQAAQTQRAAYAPPAALAGVENFGKVNDNYYRGGQPREEHYAELKKLGVKTVVDLRGDGKKWAPATARAAGLRYFNIPLAASQPATDEQTAEFLRLVNDPANWPVYVHCKGGRHRTGALTAVYRITQEGWTADEAFKEMLAYDFDNSIFGGGGRARQKKFVYAYYDRHVLARKSQE